MNILDNIAETYAEVIMFRFLALQQKELEAFCDKHDEVAMPMEIAAAGGIFGTQFGIVHCNGNPYKLAELHLRYKKMTEEIEKHLFKSLAKHPELLFEDSKGRR